MSNEAHAVRAWAKRLASSHCASAAQCRQRLAQAPRARTDAKHGRALALVSSQFSGRGGEIALARAQGAGRRARLRLRTAGDHVAVVIGIGQRERRRHAGRARVRKTQAQGFEAQTGVCGLHVAKHRARCHGTRAQLRSQRRASGIALPIPLSGWDRLPRVRRTLQHGAGQTTRPSRLPDYRRSGERRAAAGGGGDGPRRRYCWGAGARSRCCRTAPRRSRPRPAPSRVCPGPRMCHTAAAAAGGCQLCARARAFVGGS